MSVLHRLWGALKILLIAPFVLGAVAFAVANRAPVLVSLDPVTPAQPLLSFSAPLYAIVLGAVAVGVVLGGLGAWASAAGTRRTLRSLRRENARLREERAVRLDGRGVQEPRSPASASRDLTLRAPAPASGLAPLEPARRDAPALARIG